MIFTIDQLIGLDVDEHQARSLLPRIEAAWDTRNPEATWRTVSQSILTPRHPFALHQFLFAKVYEHWDRGSLGPPPAWSPTRGAIQKTNIAHFTSERGIADYSSLHAWSVNNPAEFWGTFARKVGIRFARPFTRVCDPSARTRAPRWFVGAKLNIVESCFAAPPDQPAVVHQGEGEPLCTTPYAELRTLANRVSNGLARAGLQPGDAVAIDMPMNLHAVAIYLGIVQAGCVVVSIADSLAPDEVAVRLKLADTKAIFTQDVLRRGGKELPLYEKVLAAGPPRSIVVSAAAFRSRAAPSNRAARLRDGDVAWDAFLSTDEQFTPLPRDPDDVSNVLFSSGTTGEPKAIPWTQTTPIKCVADAWFHHDVQPGERIAWPTNLGWMMGPWLIYASLVNRAAMAIFDGAPTGREFGQFVADSEVSLLGVIPSLVKTWRTTACMEGLDWSRIRRFSSTGECSNPDDMLYLMHLAGYAPIIEYCGGTEIAGGYVSATMVQPNAPSTFTTPCLGLDFVILDEAGKPSDQGEAFLVPPSLGMSTRLLKRDHDAVYYADPPEGPRGEALRRHGDFIERLPGGSFRAHGRADDTMNLGGIKVSSAEIERVLDVVPGVIETAAVAVPPPGGGPSFLWIFAVPQTPNPDQAALLAAMRRTLREHLNPLFKIENLRLLEALPRTASNKVMRRLLRDRVVAAGSANPRA
jgi:acetyl-CoA synthetase